MYSGYQEEQDKSRQNVLGGVLGLGLLAAAPFGAQAILKNRMAKKGKLSDIPNARGGQSGVRTAKSTEAVSRPANRPQPTVGLEVSPGRGRPGASRSLISTPSEAMQQYKQKVGKEFTAKGPVFGAPTAEGGVKGYQMFSDYYKNQAAQQEGYKGSGRNMGVDPENTAAVNAYVANRRMALQSQQKPLEGLSQQGLTNLPTEIQSQVDYITGGAQKTTEGKPKTFLERFQQRDTPKALETVEQYKQLTGANPYTETPRKGLLKEQEAGRQRVENLGNIVLADLQNEAALEREANAVLKDLRQSQVRDAAQDAIQTAENQADAKVYRKLRRDEDLDMNRTNIDYVQSFMTDRRIELANKGVTGKRAERILASDPNIKNAIELYAQTGDPNVFQLTRKNPSMPMQLEPQDSSFVTDLSALGKAEVDTGLFMKKDKRGAFTDPIEQREIDLVNQRGQIEERQNELRGRINQINEDENMLRAAAERTPRKGLSGQNEFDFMVNKLRQEREVLKDEGIQNAEKLFDVKSNLNRTRFELVAEEEFGGRAEPKTFTGEPKRLFFEADPETGKPLSGTFEVRSDREMKDMEAKGGGGRNVANYAGGSALEEEVRNVQRGDRKVKVRDADEFGNAISDFEGDRTQTGSVTGIYGIERGDTSTADPVVKPSTVLKASTPYQDLDDETLSMISLMGKGADAELATKESMRRKRADTSGESLKVSEGLRRARIEGRDPQSVLRRFGVVQ